MFWLISFISLLIILVILRACDIISNFTLGTILCLYAAIFVMVVLIIGVVVSDKAEKEITKEQIEEILPIGDSSIIITNGENDTVIKYISSLSTGFKSKEKKLNYSTIYIYDGEPYLKINKVRLKSPILRFFFLYAGKYYEFYVPSGTIENMLILEDKNG